MTSTFQIITRRTGDGGVVSGIHVKRIQQLLKLNGFPALQVRGIWDKPSRNALLVFRERLDRSNPSAFMFIDSQGDQPDADRPYLTPRDPVLFELAYGAKVLIRLGGGWNRGSMALDDVHDWCVNHSVGFAFGRAVWGLDGYPTWAIVTNTSKEGLYEFAMDSNRRALNCTLYANLMMSVWAHGNAHRGPFAAGIAESGGEKHLAQARYNYPKVGLLNTAEEIMAETRKHPGRLYCIEAANDSGSVHHIALLFNGQVYECNVWPRVGCMKRPLGDWLSTHTPAWLLGPSPQGG